MSPHALSDRQARNVILAAEEQSFRREPDLHPNWYDALLHDHAEGARAFLVREHPERLARALGEVEPISAEDAAQRLTNGRATVADVERIISAAEDLGFSPTPPDLPLADCIVRYDQGKAAIAFLWRSRPGVLNEILGENALLAPTPEDAWIPCPSCGR